MAEGRGVSLLIVQDDIREPDLVTWQTQGFKATEFFRLPSEEYVIPFLEKNTKNVF